MANSSAEKKLWQSVILTAVSDALATRKKELNRKYETLSQEAALKWILYDNKHYYDVCFMADINPLTLRNKVQQAIKHNNKLSYRKLI